MKNYHLLFFIAFFTYTTNVYAYFDPGSGAFILQALIAMFTAVMFYLSYPIRIIKKIFKSVKEKFTKKKDVEKQ